MDRNTMINNMYAKCFKKCDIYGDERDHALEIVNPGTVVAHFKRETLGATQLLASPHMYLYTVIGMAENTETGDIEMVYEALYGDHRRYVRPLKMFVSKVDTNKYPDIRQKWRMVKYTEDIGVKYHTVDLEIQILYRGYNEFSYIFMRRPIPHTGEDIEDTPYGKAYTSAAFMVDTIHDTILEAMIRGMEVLNLPSTGPAEGRCSTAIRPTEILEFSVYLCAIDDIEYPSLDSEDD